MDLIQLIVLALIQGLTEYLPVSSSAHLILVGQLAAWEDQGLVLDVATHWGTLLAVLIYFRRELIKLLVAVLPGSADRHPQQRRLATGLLVASVPVIVVGILAADLIADDFRSVELIAWTTIVFGLLLGLADWLGRRTRVLQDITLPAAVWIGIAQVLALVPGVSRSGITITAGLALGYDRQAAARFSFLLAIPVLTAAGAYGSYQIAVDAVTVPWLDFGLAVGLSMVTGLACIWAFLALLDRIGLWPFVIYRVILGVLLLVLA